MHRSKNCPGCGNSIPEESSSCPNCAMILKEIETTFADSVGWLSSPNSETGSAQKVEQVIDQDLGTQGDSSSPKPARLLVAEGADEGTEYLLPQGRVAIGREKTTNNFIINEPKASRNHAEITFENGQYVLTDLQSTNGTKINGDSITKHVLQSRDQIEIGGSIIVFFAPSNPAP